MAVFGIFPNEIIQNPNLYWWVPFFWLPGILMNKKPKIKRNITHGFFLGVGFYMSAFAIWLQGYPNMPLCNPDSIIQPHGIWHILSSLATLSFFFFFRTEKKL